LGRVFFLNHKKASIKKKDTDKPDSTKIKKKFLLQKQLYTKQNSNTGSEKIIAINIAGKNFASRICKEQSSPAFSIS
jgi:hypothetical protein